jgi:hypothetical protein
MHDLKNRLFFWLVRPLMPRRFDEVPPGKSDRDLIRDYEAVSRRNSLWALAVCACFTAVFWGLHHRFVAESAHRPADVYYDSSMGGLFAAFFFAVGLLLLLLASPLADVLGRAEHVRADRLGFEAKYDVNARRAYALLGGVGMAFGCLITFLSDDYVAFDREALRFGHFGGEEIKAPLGEIAEVRWYRRKEALRGTVSGGALVLLKDGRRLEPNRALSQARCLDLAKLAGVPARLDLDVMPKE